MCHYRSYHSPVGAARDLEAEDLRRRPDLRASDAEREAVVARLREHGAAGRLDVVELEERIGAAYAAKTRGELVRLLEDLPALGTAMPVRRPQQRHAHGSGDEVRVFAGVSLLLCAIWLLTGTGYFWPVWVMIWWGAALLMKMAVRPRARHGFGARPGPGR
jgi:hypothetical protein